MKRKPPALPGSSERIEVFEKLRETWGGEPGSPFLIDITSHGNIVTICAGEHAAEIDRFGTALSFVMPNALEQNIRRRRDDRQAAIYKWVVQTFGEANATIEERVLRLVEEVIELAQAENVDPARLTAIISYVYGKMPGRPEQEAGGVGTTLIAYCAARGFSADDAEAAEAERVLARDPDYFRKRHAVKAAAGIASPPPEPTKEG
jgi:hypothetical protein